MSKMTRFYYMHTVKANFLNIQVITRQKPVSLANVNATYLIVGGIGGIGRAIAEWMIEKGAQHILIISRHATSHPMAGSLKDRGIQTSCKVEIRDCDIVNEASLSHCIRDCLQFMPPIRGLINGAMVLDVRSPKVFCTRVLIILFTDRAHAGLCI